MSGPIRHLLGPTRTIFMTPITVSDLEAAESELEDLIQRFSTNISLLERCNKDWITLLSELPKGEEKTAEEKEYVWATDGDDGLIELLLDSTQIFLNCCY